ncbi:hypothetical protein MPLSOD_100108 [Mesorhizobium sp. SOD10]|nr:hypothetical protein MPLSOD_100108 [Mesorhizobium sp. SOD10]
MFPTRNSSESRSRLKARPLKQPGSSFVEGV